MTDDFDPDQPAPDRPAPASTTPAWTAFTGQTRLAAGAPADVALAVNAQSGEEHAPTVLVFDDATGRVVDLDLRGGESEIRARYDIPSKEEPALSGSARGRGRPRLGVVAREVTLLPRHWDWLSAQPGGASVTLRKLVEAARRADDPKRRRAQAHERANRFMSAMAGDLPGFEEAGRALFADDRTGVERETVHWPEGIRAYALKLAFGDT